MLLEIAIGDAYGAGFEFSSRAKIELSNTVAARRAPHQYRARRARRKRGPPGLEKVPGKGTMTRFARLIQVDD